MKQLVILTSLAAVVLVGFACSSSSNGGGSGSGTYSLTNCPNDQLTLSTSTACVDCVESKCSSQVATVNSACASTFACACPLGVDAATCASADLPDGGVTPCGAAIGSISTVNGAPAATGFFGCALTNCLAPCTPDGG
jgi:hypothetical protein